MTGTPRPTTDQAADSTDDAVGGTAIADGGASATGGATADAVVGRAARPHPPGRSGWRLGAGLVLLSAIPLTAGALRLLQLAGGPDLIAQDPRFGGFPLALVLHIVGAALFALVGILQFLPRFRRRHRGWHRRAGRLLVAAGLVAAGSALWLTLFYDPKPGTGPLLFAFRLAFATAMAFSIGRGFSSIRHGDVDGHRAWMTRAYAIGLGAGTQVVTEGVAEAVFGAGVVTGDLAKGAGWVINLLIAEWAIRRGRSTR